MDLNEQYYKRVIAAIGWALMILWGLMQLYGVMLRLLSSLLASFPLSAMATEVISMLARAVGYLAVFMIPIPFLRLFLKKSGCRPSPMCAAPRISPQLPWILCAGIAICFAAARINAAMASCLDCFALPAMDGRWGSSMLRGYDIVLDFIVISIVPGFCEELLFRGAILENLKPFGRTNAVVISALLFAAMHQNVGQLFYTFVAGIVLGLVYERTGSIWNCTLLHIVNNFISVLESTLYAELGNGFMGNMSVLLLEAVIFFLGVISVGVLIARFFSDKDRGRRDGMLGRELPASDGYATVPLLHGRASRLLCRTPVLLFLGLCALQAAF